MSANSFVQGLNMKALMESDDYVDNTAKIRELKHSEYILEDIGKICKLKKTIITCAWWKKTNLIICVRPLHHCCSTVTQISLTRL